jgi:hypothetical protein
MDHSVTVTIVAVAIGGVALAIGAVLVVVRQEPHGRTSER